jgi:hypothetical protein
MVKGTPEHLDAKNENPQGFPDNNNALDERQEAVLKAKNEARNLAHQLEIEHDSEGTLSDLVFPRGPDKSWLHEGKDKPDSPFWAPLNTEKYSHFGEKVLSHWNNVWMLEPSTLPVLGAGFVLATTGAIAGIARRVPGDVLSLALHPVREFKYANEVWKNWMPEASEENWMS